MKRGSKSLGPRFFWNSITAGKTRFCFVNRIRLTKELLLRNVLCSSSSNRLRELIASVGEFWFFVEGSGFVFGAFLERVSRDQA
jgi:hypothetical protein